MFLMYIFNRTETRSLDVMGSPGFHREDLRTGKRFILTLKVPIGNING